MKRLWMVLFLWSCSLPTARAQFTHASATAIQDGLNPALIQATDALFLNPGALLHTTGFALSLLQTDTQGGGDFLRFDLYNRYLTRGYQLTGQQTDALLRKWFGGEDRLPCPSFLPCFSFIQAWTGRIDTLRTIGAVNQFTPLILTFRAGPRAFGLAIRLRQHSRIRLNRGLMDLLLIGTDEDRTIRLRGNIQTTSFTEIVLGYAQTYMEGRLHIGIAPRLLLGAQVAEASLQSTVDISANVIRHTYTYQLRTAGALNDLLEGFHLFDNPRPNTRAYRTFSQQFAGLGINGIGAGVGLGMRYLLSPRLHLGVSVTDIGFIRWMKHARIYTPGQSSLTFNGIHLSLNRLRQAYNYNLSSYISAAFDSLARTAYGKVNKKKQPFITVLPAALHLGIAYTRSSSTALGLALSMGLNNATGNLSRIPLFTFSGQTRFLLFPLFAGLQIGGGSALNLYAGTGLQMGPLSLRVALSGTPRSRLLGVGSRFGLMSTVLRMVF